MNASDLDDIDSGWDQESEDDIDSQWDTLGDGGEAEEAEEPEEVEESEPPGGFSPEQRAARAARAEERKARRKAKALEKAGRRRTRNSAALAKQKKHAKPARGSGKAPSRRSDEATIPRERQGLERTPARIDGPELAIAAPPSARARGARLPMAVLAAILLVAAGAAVYAWLR